MKWLVSSVLLKVNVDVIPVFISRLMLVHVLSSPPQAVVVMGLVLQWANLYGYVRCKFGGQTNLRNMAQNYLGAQIFKQVCEV